MATHNCLRRGFMNAPLGVLRDIAEVFLKHLKNVNMLKKALNDKQLDICMSIFSDEASYWPLVGSES